MNNRYKTVIELTYSDGSVDKFDREGTYECLEAAIADAEIKAVEGLQFADAVTDLFIPEGKATRPACSIYVLDTLSEDQWAYAGTVKYED